MCYFIYLAVPKHEADALKLLAQHSLEVEEFPNASISHQLPPGFSTFHLVSDGCSCVLYREDASPDPVRLHDKYKKKGWSEAKIQRAIEQSSQSATRNFRGFRDDVLEVIKDARNAVSRLGVMVTWNDEATLRSPQHVTVNALRDSVPPQGELLWIES